MDTSKLQQILDQHAAWLRGDEGGKRATLRGANLRDADLTTTTLRGADLRWADLCNANLRAADLRGTDLRDADLRAADLRNATLRGADLCDADLCNANLRAADLRGADLCGADLRDADLTDADLRGADLDFVVADEGTAGYWWVCPETGAFEGWKKLRGGRVARLLIPAAARRSSATGRKCRAEFVDVLEIIDAQGSPVDAGFSKHDMDFVYRVGERATAHKWDTDRWNECGGGVHFFMTRREAERY